MMYPQNFWDSRYTNPEYAYGTLPNEFFKAQLDALGQPGHLLLLAEGEGRNAVYAAEKGWQVTAVDFSAVAQDKALKLAAEKGVSLEYRVENIQAMDFSQNAPWDVIGLIYAHFPATIRAEIHQKCVNALAPGGHIILEAFHLKQLERASGGPKDAAMLYSTAQMAQDFAGLQVVENSASTVYLREGKGHEGPGEVIRFLAKKVK